MRVTPMVLAVAAGIGGCGSPPPPPPPAVLTLTVTGGADQNPDAAGHPFPVAVHLYQLTSTARFERADVFALLEKEKETLGDELAAADLVLVAPGDAKTMTVPLKPGVTSIGGAVAFRSIDTARWRVSAPAKASGPFALALTLAGTAATLQAPHAPPAKSP